MKSTLIIENTEKYDLSLFWTENGQFIPSLSFTPKVNEILTIKNFRKNESWVRPKMKLRLQVNRIGYDIDEGWNSSFEIKILAFSSVIDLIEEIDE